ncbi:hypothetical protein QQG74_06950 [Micromonospora sp. FIMYZ51]|uniref:hypothetical protein n=1 Tax=Micromonospora sp. FIMYZ51 TaxID=3051832 RepID=UPI00311F29D5
MTAPGASAFEAAFEEKLTEINELLDEIQQLINAVAVELNNTMRRLPSPVCWAISRSWDFFLPQANKYFDRMQEFIGAPGYPPALFRLGDYWDLHVGTPVSGEQQVVSAFGMKADDKWTGSAASAYKDSAEAQARAVGTIKPLAERIQNVLNDLAWGIIAFWAALIVAAGTFVVGMAGALGLAASVFGAPAAPIDAGATVATVVGLLGAAVLAYVAYAEKIQGSMSTMQQALNDNGGLVVQGGQGSWPRVDGSTYDGTGRWRVNY